MSEFKWDDETVREFIEFGRRLHHISDQDILGLDIKQFKQSKQPKALFTTEDGVEVYQHNKGGSYIRLSDWVIGSQNWFAPSCAEHKGLFKYFSTYNAAEIYLLENKPVPISLIEVNNLIRQVSDEAKGVNNKAYLRGLFKDLFRLKINNQ